MTDSSEDGNTDISNFKNKKPVIVSQPASGSGVNTQPQTINTADVGNVDSDGSCCSCWDCCGWGEGDCTGDCAEGGNDSECWGGGCSDGGGGGCDGGGFDGGGGGCDGGGGGCDGGGGSCST